MRWITRVNVSFFVSLFGLFFFISIQSFAGVEASMSGNKTAAVTPHIFEKAKKK